MSYSRYKVIFLVLFLIFAAANGLSYFFQTENALNQITGRSSFQGIQLGFPLSARFWYHTAPASLSSSISLYNANGLAAFFLSAGGVMLFGKGPQLQLGDLNNLLAVGPKIQFSIRHLLITTTVVSVVLSVIGKDFTSADLMLAIYLCGPILFLLMVMFTRRLGSLLQAAVPITTFILLGYAAFMLTEDLYHDGTIGVFGCFVCWVPQFVGMLLIALFFRLRKQTKLSQADASPKDQISCQEKIV